VVYDDHQSASDAARAFQRLKGEDKAVAVLATYTSEVALALEPWSARLKMPYATPGAASNNISEQVHKDYDRFKYTFHAWFTSYFIAESTVDSARDLLVDQLHMKTCVIMSEDADWTTPLDAAYMIFLPKAGLKVLDHIRFSPDTTDYTPIFDRIEAKKPDVIITGLSHVGVVPTVQWAEQKVPIPMYGVSSQATSSAFWGSTHGACEGVTSQTGAAPDSAITPKTLPFTRDFQKRYNVLPAYCGYSSYDMIHIFADAIERVKSTDPDQMVTGLEATDYIGTIGRIKFYGRNDRFTHALEYGIDLCPGVMLQWQHAKMKTIWPVKYATAKISFPSFVRLPA
ncbi:MAG: ABC transporter substrate-binding protein, partial [Acetobacteraceae bacterium]